MKPDAEEQFQEYCRHIVHWGERIPSIIGERSFEEFANDEAVYLAVWECVKCWVKPRPAI